MSWFKFVFLFAIIWRRLIEIIHLVFAVFAQLSFFAAGFVEIR